MQDYESILKNQLEDMPYSHSKAVYLTKCVSDAMKARSKLEHAPRYKFIVCTTLVDNSTKSSTTQANRCLWNVETDNSFTVQYQSKHLYASATIFAVYTD
ncbi:hypothetical protein EB796_012641 [Bugula neritina]|uniref:TCTEX1D1 n=1 Tax=Bugula neritina TaxID=10212 RepID=A0A7J7JUG3_BUGNE|nr:hypothetical protein EB796_012641 [Bugula neritina]